jgi:DNA repair protein RadD
MGLIDLIKNLDAYTKTKLLGNETTQILRYTFVNNDSDAIEDAIVNQAVAAQLGPDLIQKKEYRKLLIESIRQVKLASYGIEDYDSAIIKYADVNSFIKDFEIEEEFILQKVIDDRKNIEFVDPEHNETYPTSSFPHDYQKRMKDIINGVLYTKLNPAVLASMPTGAGKTVLAMEIITDAYRFIESSLDKKMSVLWLVNSKELCEQSLKSFQKIWKQKGDHRVYCERFFGGFNTLDLRNDSKITFASFDLLVARLNSRNTEEFIANVDLLVIDEAHYSEATTYSLVIDNYKKLKADYKMIGLTATPYRADDDEFKSLKDKFNFYFQITNDKKEVIESPISYLIDGQYLSNIKYELLSYSEGDVSKSEYYKTLHQSILKECENIIKKKENTIIFAQSKSHAIALSIFLKTNAVENGLIVGETSDLVRKELLNKFGDKSQSISVLVNHQILSTGIDVPGMNSIMILGEINSPSLGLQILGRAMRGPKNGGNKENTVYLTKDNYKKLSEYKLLEATVLN